MSSNNKFIDLSNRTFGEWKVLEYEGHGHWKCQCSCGKIKSISGQDLRRGDTHSCGHNKKSESNLKDQTFGEWKVLGKASKPRYYTCQCSCGKIVDVSAYSLTHGLSKSCGHNTSSLKDISHKRFGSLIALDYAGNGKWRCQCDCNRITLVSGQALKSGNTKSCGCMGTKNAIDTKIKRYGDFRNAELPRSKWQIDIINNKEYLSAFIQNLIVELGRKVSNQEIADRLGVTRTAVYEAAKKFGIEDYKLDKYHSLHLIQNEVCNYIKSIYQGNIIENTRKIISPLELDIYIPDKHIAVEFNGNYWHSELNKEERYHQRKTISCAKQGIHLIHIFEYEWHDPITRDKIKKLLQYNLCNSTTRVYARDTEVKVIDNVDAKEFCNNYHLQNGVNSSVNIGCYYNKELIGVMTFGKPRFNANYSYEILRLCFKDNINAIGGTEKMFKYFLRLCNPSSIITYADISKFTGNIYTKLGFKVIEITRPNYVWVNLITKDVLTRYQTQKHKLLAQGIGTKEQTEAEIMNELGYSKIYDSGNLKLEWFKDSRI